MCDIGDDAAITSLLSWEMFYSLSTPKMRRGRRVSFNEVTEVVVMEAGKTDGKNIKSLAIAGVLTEKGKKKEKQKQY